MSEVTYTRPVEFYAGPLDGGRKHLDENVTSYLHVQRKYKITEGKRVPVRREAYTYEVSDEHVLDEKHNVMVVFRLTKTVINET